jgi:hypothetical protein
MKVNHNEDDIFKSLGINTTDMGTFIEYLSKNVLEDEEKDCLSKELEALELFIFDKGKEVDLANLRTLLLFFYDIFIRYTEVKEAITCLTKVGLDDLAQPVLYKELQESFSAQKH